MILGFLEKISLMLYASPWISILGAFLWGIASVILSPCHLSSIPLVMGFVAKESQGAQKKAILLSLVFTLGIMISMVVLGLITTALGRFLGDIGSWGYWLGAGVFILVGFLLLDIINLPSLSLNQNRFRGKGFPAALLLGLLFGTVLGPCAFAFIMPVLSMVFTVATERPLFASSLVLAYALGHGLVIVLAGSASTWTMSLVQNSNHTRWIKVARKMAAFLCFVIAIYYLFK